jgi:hypothetical protein
MKALAQGGMAGLGASFCKALQQHNLRADARPWPSGHEACLVGGMDCYFGTCDLPTKQPDGKTAIVMFCIPEIGIRFKAPFAAVDRDHGDLASMLALLEFIDSNQKHLTGKNYQLYGDNLSVINQVNGRASIRYEFQELMKKAAAYREKLRFSVDWVPGPDNAAIEELLH